MASQTAKLSLGINTALDPLGYAICNETELLLERSQKASREFTENIMLEIQKDLIKLGFGLEDLSCIGIIKGPGTYTGLRIGIATARTWSQTLSLPIYALDTFTALAKQVQAPNNVFGIIIPGKKNYITLQLFNTEHSPCSDPVSLNKEELTQFLSQCESPFTIYGHCDPHFYSCFDTEQKISFETITLNAKIIAKTALNDLVSGKKEDQNLSPYYFHDPNIGTLKKK